MTPMLPHRVVSLATLLVTGLLLTGCSGRGGKTVAVVTGQVITEADVAHRMTKLPASYRQALGGNQRRLLEEMVLETLLFQEARKRGLDRDPLVQELLTEAKRQIMIGRLMEQEGQREGPVGDPAVAEYYDQHKAEFSQPERWRVSQILVPTEPQAKQVLDRLGRGESFGGVAEELSQDPSKTKGGDLGYFSRGQLIPEFEEAVFQLKVGQTSGVVKTSLGYHVISLADHQLPQQRGLGDVREQIVQDLQSRRGRSRVDQFVGQLRRQAHVFIRDDAAQASAAASPDGGAGDDQPKAIPDAPAAVPAR